MKELIKKITPQFILSSYHASMAMIAALVYGFPSRKMTVIGVTGTNGKSTTVNLIGKLLMETGLSVGWTSTINFRVGDKEWLNDTKMTMVGRFQLQRLLRQMVKAGCQHAIVETSSEGIKQFRHLGVDYDVAVFTNLTPEHIEAHGSFEKYKEAKGKLFAKLAKKDGGISIINLDDKHAKYFLDFKADNSFGFGIDIKKDLPVDKKLQAKDIKMSASGINFKIDGVDFNVNLLGKFNVYNTLAAIGAAQAVDVDLKTCAKVLTRVKSMPGRLEFIEEGQDFKVMVDYAYDPDQLKEVYKVLREHFEFNKIIQILGPTGGGRDQARVPVLGKMASEFADKVFITTDDPYDEDPDKLADQMISGIDNENKYKIDKVMDRKSAIKKAIKMAGRGDLVLITGKGCDQAICMAAGRKIEWDDREITREILQDVIES